MCGIFFLFERGNFIMKHLIIFNPAAGKANDGGAAFEQKIKESFEGLDYEIYKTTGPRAVVDFLKGYLKKNAKDTVRVYACGGDGTVNELNSLSYQLVQVMTLLKSMASLMKTLNNIVISNH